MKKKTIIFLFVAVAIIILAALPRSIEFINKNYLFGFDQGKHWLAAKSIVVDHKLPLIGDEVGGRGGFFQGPGWYYLLAIPFFLFQGDPYGAIVLMFIMSVAIIVLFLFLFKKYLGERETILGGYFLAISPILIINSRFAWPPFIIPFLTVIYLWFVILVLEKKYYSISGLFFIIGLMSHFEIATAGTLFISTVFFLSIIGIKNKIPFFYIIFGAVAFLIPFLPLFIFDFRHDFLNYKGIMDTITGSKRYVGTPVEYFKIVSNHWMIFFDEFFRAFQVSYIPKIYIIGFLVAGAIAIILDKGIRQTKKMFVGFLFTLPIVLFCVFLFYKDDLWPWWISELTVVYVVLAGIVCVYAWQKGLVMRILIVSIIGLMSVSYIQGTYYSLTKELSDYGGTKKIKGKTDAIDAIYKDAGPEQFGLYIFTPPIYTYPYTYILWWHGQKQYGYIPPEEKKETFYLLIEPDPVVQWRHTGWIETVIKDGVIEKSWQLPSGFIIEKRKMERL